MARPKLKSLLRILSTALLLNTTYAKVDCSTYTNTIQLKHKVTLDYVSTDTTLSIRMTSTDHQGFLAFGISDNQNLGVMKGSEAIIGTTPNNVQYYSLTSSMANYIQDTNRQNLINTTFTQDDDGSVLECTLLLSDGSGNKVIDGTGSNVFIWARGRSNLIYEGHDDARGQVILNLSPCDEDQDAAGIVKLAKPNDKNLLFVHGMLAIMAFALFMPISVAAAAGRKLLSFDLCNKKAWYVIHISMNSLAYITSLIMLSTAISAVKQKGSLHFDSSHEIVGLVTFILLTIQVLYAIFRPSAPHVNMSKTMHETSEDDSMHIDAAIANKREIEGHNNNDDDDEQEPQNTNSTKSSLPRSIWEKVHRLVAVFIFGCGLYQIHTGLTLYKDLYGGSVDYVPSFWIASSFFFVILISFVIYSKQ